MSDNNQSDIQIEKEKENKDGKDSEESEKSEENENEEEKDEDNFNIPIQRDIRNYSLRP
jgi:hypothetical protein